MHGMTGEVGIANPSTMSEAAAKVTIGELLPRGMEAATGASYHVHALARPDKAGHIQPPTSKTAVHPPPVCPSEGR